MNPKDNFEDVEVYGIRRPAGLSAYSGAFWSAKWKILAKSLIVGILAFIYSLILPNIYRSSAVIKPENPESNKITSGIGALESFGMQVGGPSKAEDLAILLKSDDLAIRVFRKYDVWSIILNDGNNVDAKGFQSGWFLRLIRSSTGGKDKKFGDWDAVRMTKKSLSVVTDRKTGALTIAFDSQSPQGSTQVVRNFLEEAKSRLQEEALNRTKSNKQFIQEQIGKALDPLVRDRLFSLYGQEMEKEMLAKNREQFGFVVIDSPKIPDRKISPRRLRIIGAATLFSVFFFSTLFIYISVNKPKAEDKG